MNRIDFKVIEIDVHRIVSLKTKYIEMSPEVIRREIRNGEIGTIRKL